MYVSPSLRLCRASSVQLREREFIPTRGRKHKTKPNKPKQIININALMHCCCAMKSCGGPGRFDSGIAELMNDSHGYHVVWIPTRRASSSTSAATWQLCFTHIEIYVCMYVYIHTYICHVRGLQMRSNALLLYFLSWPVLSRAVLWASIEFGAVDRRKMAQATAGGRISVLARHCNSTELLRSRAVNRSSAAAGLVEVAGR